MQVASPDSTPQPPNVTRHAPARAPALRGALHGVLNVPVDAPLAPLLAVAVGGGAGAGLSLLCNGTSRLLGDALVGSVLGVVSHQFARGRHLDEAAHGRRWDVLNDVPKMRAWLQDEGIRYVDRKRVEHVHDSVQTVAQGMVDHYLGYCMDHGMVCDPQAVEAIIRFCTGECVERGPFMALQPHNKLFYLAAIDDESCDALTRELREGQPARAAFRRRGCVFMSRELVAVARPAGSSPRLDPPASPMCRPLAALPAPDRTSIALADCYRPSVDSMVIIRHRRTSNLRVYTTRRPQRWWEDRVEA